MELNKNKSNRTYLHTVILYLKPKQLLIFGEMTVVFMETIDEIKKYFSDS